ncbi:DUF2726 domain-containing protein [Jannaschia pohangensis]|uniref:DUF2726 domain-containing protein n=1 Tax=Jannaschia pohangensis TaxID=390807 RepID=A0A1I3LWD8_9RHOB|nr:DUF2726 domain-containing protein [Jannaschia pohangensis]SFI89081.1 Protein of unknown function [Jannaschia pohangensis]
MISSSLILFIFGAFAGLVFMTFAVIDIMAKVKARRSKAEIRRQRRHHQAELTRERQAHAAEIAALREQLRDQHDAVKPFDAIAASRIERMRLMNRGEYRLYRVLMKAVADLPTQTLVWPQIPMGEVLRIVPSCGTEAQRRRASQELQCKRFDFALTDPMGHLVAAVELQGQGHYQGTAAWRDQIKQALLKQAGIPLIEVFPEDTDAQIARKLDAVLGRSRPAITARPVRSAPVKPLAAT